MSLALADRPVELGGGHGGLPARRAVLRWAWRLFRREWRQQSLLLAMLLVAVAATTVGLAVATSVTGTEAARFGTANHIATLSSTGAQADADVAQLRAAFGTVEVIQHQKIAVPGSANAVDLRAQDPAGPYGASMLRLVSGRYPQGPDEIAVTERVATIFGLHVGASWTGGGRQRQVVGLVENPLDLSDRFALVAAGQLATPEETSVLILATRAKMGASRGPDGLSIQRRSDDPVGASASVLALATIGLLFVGLLAVAGFTVMAQRRMRALGMLGAIGASHRHIRLVLVANGAAVGAVGALAGAVAGLGAWVAFGPMLEPLIGRRIDRFGLPWLPIAGAVLLAIVTAVAAAWWPARAASRVPVVAALSARPVPPRPAHRFAAVGAVFLAGGLGALVLARQDRAGYIIGGVLATALGLLLFAPFAIAVLGRFARFAPLAARLALRDLTRYRARSGAALAAIGLAVGIAATVALAAGVSVAKAAAPTGGNLPADQIIVWMSDEGLQGPVPTSTPAQVEAARPAAEAIAAAIDGTSTVPLQVAQDPTMPAESGGRPVAMLAIPHTTMEGGRRNTVYHGDEALPLFVATPELLTHYGVDPATIAADTDIVTHLADISGYDVIPGRDQDWQPKTQHADLPAYTSLPGSLLTAHGLQSRKMTAVAIGWLITAPKPLTQAQIDKAQQQALAAGMSVETRPTGADAQRLARYATGTGIAVALGVLAMTVGLIRSETARDLRTLTAAGASRRIRRALTAATAGALALLGAVLGTAVAYLAMLAWFHSEPHWLGQVPVPELIAIVAGLPVLAYAGGWLLAGREAPALARSALD